MSERLGLVLKHDKVSIEVLVIDDAQKPLNWRKIRRHANLKTGEVPRASTFHETEARITDEARRQVFPWKHCWNGS